ncbi:hypothetical protein QZH41_002503 [Actinostola sp. cb2023]|nr:hypothetical protein QZH41_002503 [Actinostola sp. cb2023]
MVRKKEALEEDDKEALEEDDQEALEEDDQEALEEDDQEALEEDDQEALEEDDQEALEEDDKEALEEDDQETLEEDNKEALEEDDKEALEEDGQEALEEDDQEALEEDDKEALEEDDQEALGELCLPVLCSMQLVYFKMEYRGFLRILSNYTIEIGSQVYRNDLLAHVLEQKENIGDLDLKNNTAVEDSRSRDETIVLSDSDLTPAFGDSVDDSPGLAEEVSAVDQQQSVNIYININIYIYIYINIYINIYSVADDNGGRML